MKGIFSLDLLHNLIRTLKSRFSGFRVLPPPRLHLLGMPRQRQNAETPKSSIFPRKAGYARGLFLCFCFLSLSLIAEEKTQPRRVYVDAVGDLFHYGHVAIFQKARQEGDYLIVGIHSDETVASYKRTPIMTMEERIGVVRACRYVDEVVPNAPLHLTEEYIKKHNIDLVVHGDDISKENLEMMYGEAVRLGKFKMFPYTQGVSTTDIIKRVLSSHDLQIAETPVKKEDSGQKDLEEKKTL